jgi:RNA polymerase sigma-70 factor, ECF subfamily
MELLFRRLYPQLCAFANKFLHDVYDSEEVVQEVFYAVWKNRARLDETQSLKSYLFKAVKNSCFNMLEHDRVRDRYAEILLSMYAERDRGLEWQDPLIVSELEKDFSQALKTLPPDCRRIFELSRLEGMTYHQIAEQLNISIKTVETQMSRALSKIRVQLKDYLLLLIIIELS